MDDETRPFGPVLYSYSRAQAFADGVLVDVSETARAAKFTIPVAITATVWARCVEVPDDVKTLSQPVRLWNLLAELIASPPHPPSLAAPDRRMFGAARGR